MKKVFIIAAAMLISTAAVAQNSTKEAQAIQKRIEKSDATIADAKKASSANAWLERATVMIDAATVYTKQLITEIPVAQMLIPSVLGNPQQIEETQVAGVDMDKYVYEKFDMYVSKEGTVQYWVVKDDLRAGAFTEAVTSLKKAKELNAKDFSKTGRGVTIVDRLVTESSILGRNLYMLTQYLPAGKLFKDAYEASELKGAVDSISLYYSGICFFDAGDYKTALSEFEQLLSFGSQQSGMTLSYIAGCYDKLDQKEKAIETYEKAFNLFPENSNIMGGLINAYMSADKSPEKLIELIKKAQDLDSTNISLYLVESQIWEKIGNRQNAVKAIEEAQRVDPNSLDAFFNAAVLSLLESDDLVEKANKLDINDSKTYDAMMVEVKELRLKAIEQLEKAYSINPEVETTTSLLSQIYFICRDYSKDILDKYEKFKADHPQE